MTTAKKKVKVENRGKAKKPRRSGRRAIKDYKVVDPKNRPTEEEMSKKKGGRSGNMERLVYKTLDWIKEGIALDVCKEILTNEINPSTKRPYHIRFVNEIVHEANKLIKQSYNYHKTQIVSLHTKRYDKQIQELLNIDVSRWEPYKQVGKKIEAYMYLLDVLQQKETLLGMHRKSFKIVINNEQTTVVRDKKPKIDISKLTLDEQIEFNTLLEKARRSEEDLISVILNDNANEVIEDVECEVVEKKNIDKMEHRKTKELNPVPVGSTMLGIEDKLKLALQRKAKEEFKKAGSKTVRDEIINENL